MQASTEQAVAASALAPGLRLGRYELIHRLAVGGMAEIYLARATGIEGFEKLVVLKRILPQFAENREFVSMFLDEARLSATLQHPNIAQVHDIGQHDGSYFFTMEYVRGEDVRGILRAAATQKKRLPLAHTLTIIVGTAAGLHAAHEKRGLDGTPLNVVHRDVSPSNVLVAYDGSVKVVDFGVAKAAQRQTQTRAGTLKGKVAYMSPEQCVGKDIDRRSDVFALGIMLYELTTGRRLFKGDSEFELMTRIVNEDVTPPSEILPRYPKALERIVLRALQRKREDRYETAQDMQLDIETFASQHRLSISTVKLGQFMRELFADRMREQEALLRPRASTAEIAEAAAARTAVSAKRALDSRVFAATELAADLSRRSARVLAKGSATSIRPPAAESSGPAASFSWAGDADAAPAQASTRVGSALSRQALSAPAEQSRVVDDEAAARLAAEQSGASIIIVREGRKWWPTAAMISIAIAAVALWTSELNPLRAPAPTPQPPASAAEIPATPAPAAASNGPTGGAPHAAAPAETASPSAVDDQQADDDGQAATRDAADQQAGDDAQPDDAQAGEQAPATKAKPGSPEPRADAPVRRKPPRKRPVRKRPERKPPERRAAPTTPAPTPEPRAEPAPRSPWDNLDSPLPPSRSN